ncbi:peptidylprolyl isomerase [Bacteriovoracaceae bacterium]|nr:peptidylprolyl isomerase [Bacteriovoracaceae bacterium]
MKLTFKIFIFSALLIVTATSLFSQSSGDPNDEIVAEINGVKISRARLNQYYSENLKFVYNKQVTLKSSLNEIANRIIGIDKAKKGGLPNNPIVQERFDDILFHAQISKDLEKKIASISVTDKEVEKYYSKNKEYRVQQILLRLRAQPSPEEVEKQLKAAFDIHQEVKKQPQSFAAYARKFSQSTTYVAGGEMGFQPAVRLGPAISNEIQGKVNGTITKPLRTPYGIHIVKVLGVKDFRDINKNLYKKILFDVKRDNIMKDYFTRERKSAKIKILDSTLK